MSQSLQDFINHARGKGLDYVTIRQLLLAAGWKEKDIARAIAAEGLEIAVPEPAGGGSTRDSFIYLMSFVSLYVVVGSAIGLYYTFLDHLYPDPAWGDGNIEAMLDGVRYAIAAIVIAFPLFLILSLVLQRVVRQAPDSHKQPVARWLTYLTMFLAAAVMMGDVITLLYYFLDGSLTTRFVLKVVVLLVIAQVILAYYYLAPSGVAKGQSAALRRLLEATGVLIVAGAIALGFALAGSPLTARQYRMDEKRVEDLRAIHRAIQQMATKTDKNTSTVKAIRALPKTLDEVADYQTTHEAGRKLDLVDPQTGEPYGYTVTGEKTYELCATFELAREKKRDLFWNHAAGRHYFKFNAESPP
jgi:hypothetical protein